MKPFVELLIIDPQNDFCDLPADSCPTNPLSGRPLAPALPVRGAHADLTRLATLMRCAREHISGITVTLDSHHRVDIAHPAFWLDSAGAPVAPFTTISASDVRQGKYRPRLESALPRVQTYIDELEARGRYQLLIWPVHCEIGTWGHNVHAMVQAASQEWSEARCSNINYVYKGSNPWTEHYSAMQAEVPDADDTDTQLNTALIARLDHADHILIAGQASSHCVKATTEHLVDNLPSRLLGKVTLITDCMSPVPGFEAQAQGFIADMQAKGVRLATHEDVMRTLIQS